MTVKEQPRSPGVLDEEVRYFEENLPDWLKSHPDQFVAIRGDQVLGFFASSEDAVQAGVEQLGFGKHYLVRRVTEEPESPGTYPILATR